jgi:hypothetical protein
LVAAFARTRVHFTDPRSGERGYANDTAGDEEEETVAETTAGRDRYSQPNPYEVLGVAPDASAAAIRDRYAQLQRDLQEAGGKAGDRAKEKERLDAAYNQLRVAGSRMRVDFFMLDNRLGLAQCEALAKALAKPNTDIQGLIKPRQLRVTHATLLDELAVFVGADSAKVPGLYLRPMDVGEETVTLPEPLAVEFDS